MSVRGNGGVGRAYAHESAHLHVSGRAHYADDLPEIEGMLHAAIGTSNRAHAGLHAVDLGAVAGAEGVHCVLTAADVPGHNNYGALVDDDPIFAEGCVEYVGQPIYAVVADSPDRARAATRFARIDYEDREALLDAESALAAKSFVTPSRRLGRGQPAQSIRRSRHRLKGRLHAGGQDHFYLECQIAIAVPAEDGCMQIVSSTQHPDEVQRLVAGALGITAKDVLVECRRMGGAFGGKETQAALVACVAAVAAARTGRPVKLRLNRDEDMIMTGKRHPFLIDYRVGFTNEGRIEGIELELVSDCGRSADLSDAVNLRAMFHCDNCYFLEHVSIQSHRCRTNLASNTAFRGFGGPQAMLAIESVVDDIARFLGKDPLEVRRLNFYRIGERDTTPYQMRVEDNVIDELVDELEERADYARRRREIDAFNARGGVLRRGLALTPLKFGISFTAVHLNQAGALLNVYTDGSVLINHGGTEMGQGLFTKVAQVVAEELQIDIGQVRCTAADTSKVPNASATAASASSDLNGRAAQAAAREIRQRLAGFAAATHGVAPEQVRFRDGRIEAGAKSMSFRELVEAAYRARVSLSATGFYRTPKIGYDETTLTGRPFYYFCYGAAVSEVVVDTLTGEHRLAQVDVLHDVGKSLNPAIDRGQIEGGFVQGLGWLTSEELHWSDTGRLDTHGPSTYKIPTSFDLPLEFNVDLMDWHPNRERNIFRSKAVGEPPLMLAVAVFMAIKDAIASCSSAHLIPVLNAPATPEAVLTAIERLRRLESSPASPEADIAG